ncbi:MAG TPA: type IV toxin-antitoxin system AbiEi family antitoxin domain-containing protein [Solirubrobacterales bacterium]|nr:type IV toxin-antitoxin system AbiEi family antitoxin domain-containing protein [Solirubrobacterales bacterium]
MLAGRQHGVVSIRQLHRLGYSPKAVRRAVGVGRLHRLHHGVYAVGHTNLSLQGRCLAAVLASGPRALLSHYSAGWLLGLVSTRPIPVHVTTPIPRKRRGSVRIHHSRTLIDADQALEERIPVTSVARTALDLAAVVRFRSLRRLIRRSEELKVFDLADFRSVLARNRGHRGALPLDRAIDIYEPPRFTRSELERESLALLQGAGLPTPSTAFVVAGHELDLYWPDLRFGIEIDVYATHGGHESFEVDRRRDEDLKLAGIELSRVTGRRLEREPKQVARRIGELLNQRRRQLGGGR